MELFLVWDSESEITKEGTMLDTTHRAVDGSSDDGSSPVKHKKKKKKKGKKRKSTSSSSSSEAKDG